MAGTTGIRLPSRKWLVIVAVAVLVHLLLLLTFKTEYLEVFRRKLVDDPGVSSLAAAPRDAIIVVPLEVESDAPEPVPVEPQPVQPPRRATSPVNGTGDADAVNILDIVGQAQAPKPTQPGTASAIVPPRPVEITWPQTEKLGHCLGLHIDIRIRVGADGRIMRVEPVETGYPADCTQAAIDAAQRIRFQPGTVDGNARAMWTQIRIEFRRQRH